MSSREKVFATRTPKYTFTHSLQGQVLHNHPRRSSGLIFGSSSCSFLSMRSRSASSRKIRSSIHCSSPSSCKISQRCVDDRGRRLSLKGLFLSLRHQVCQCREGHVLTENDTTTSSYVVAPLLKEFSNWGEKPI